VTIFDYISNILFTKKENCFSTVDDEKQFSPYLINRWLSMYGKSTISACDIANKYTQVFSNKAECYKFLSVIFPKVTQKKIEYIKKKKTEEDDANFLLLAKNKELSVREIKNYIDLLKS
jgi:hypothetical protein